MDTGLAGISSSFLASEHTFTPGAADPEALSLTFPITWISSET